MAGFKRPPLSGRKRRPAGRFDTQKKRDDKAAKSAPPAGPRPQPKPRPTIEVGDGELSTPAPRPPVKRFAREAPSFATRRKEREAINAGKEAPSLARGKRKPIVSRPKVKAFRVLIVAHRPKYRARCERACSDPIWEVRALLNREDPIGMMHQEVPAALVISVDIAEKTNTGYLRASQAYRAQGMKVLALFESEEDAEALKASFDVGLVVPWKTEQVEEKLSLWYRAWAKRVSEKASD